MIPFPSNLTVTYSQHTNLTIRAHFLPIELDVSVSSFGEGEISLNQNNNYRYGDIISVNASASDHWEFSHWESNLKSSPHPDINITLTENTDLTAVFEKKKYDLQITCLPLSFGNAFTSTNKYKFFYGDTIDIRAIAKNGKRFVSGVEHLFKIASLVKPR